MSNFGSGSFTFGSLFRWLGPRRRSVPPAHNRPYPVSIKPRDIAAEPVPAGGGIDCFDTPGARATNRARLDHLDGLALDLRGKRLLDVGCGVGHLGEHFRRLGCRVTCVDGREENIVSLRQRYPGLEGHVADVMKEGALTRFGRFDVVLCYGLLYHLANPLAGLSNLAAVCDDLLLLETCVCDSQEPVFYLVDEPKSANQALDCLACRPSPSWVTMALNRVGFPYVYAPAEPPDYPDFHIEWRNDLGHWRDEHVIRCIFVASRRPVENPRLVDLLDRG